MVLLHGGALTSTVWAPLLAHLPGRSLYLVDLPGCGLAAAFDYRGTWPVTRPRSSARSWTRWAWTGQQ